jgi:ABC-type nitrate/sulfonate/bicarbonate transport system permease component
VLLASAVVVSFALDISTLVKLPSINSLRVVVFLSKLVLLSAPVGAVLGIVFGNLVLRSSRLTIDIIDLLRIAQWAPFLIVWTLAFELTGWGQHLSWAWLATYCAIAVGLRATYEYLLIRYFDDIDGKSAIKQIVRPAIMQGLLIALLLDMFVLPKLWSPWAGGGVDYSVSIVLATITLLINWVAGETFHSNASNRARLLIKTFEMENFASLIGPSLIVLFCLLLWLVTAPLMFTVSPVTIFARLSTWLSEGEFYGDVSVSLGELGAGMLISGSLAAAIVFLRRRFPVASNVSDPLVQACQLAPIAALPNLQYLFGIGFSRWSILCVAIFTFYPFLWALTGFDEVSVVPRLALATSEALPYGCAAFIFGEMWNATAGIGFMMTVAAATYEVDKGMAGFVVLVSLFAMTYIILHWIAKKLPTGT